MRLDRNVNASGLGKYALVNLRRNTIEWGNTDKDEFFVIKLKDFAAPDALKAYAKAIERLAQEVGGHRMVELSEYAYDIYELAEKAERNPHRKIPD